MTRLRRPPAARITSAVVRRVADRAFLDDAPPAPSATELCRKARHIRATLAASPQRMHERLRDLTVSGSPMPIAPPTADEAFRAFVERSMAANPTLILRYSERLRLLEQADRLGLLRFDANLIIASVQHRHARTLVIRQRTSHLYLLPVIAFLTVQSTVVLAYYYLLHS